MNISKSTAPKEKISARARSLSLPIACGAIYWNVPTMVPVSVSPCDTVDKRSKLRRRRDLRRGNAIFAKPKSRSFCARFRQDHVAGFEVAVGDAAAMGGAASTNNLHGAGNRASAAICRGLWRAARPRSRPPDIPSPGSRWTHASSQAWRGGTSLRRQATTEISRKVIFLTDKREGCL